MSNELRERAAHEAADELYARGLQAYFDRENGVAPQVVNAHGSDRDEDEDEDDDDDEDAVTERISQHNGHTGSETASVSVSFTDSNDSENVDDVIVDPVDRRARIAREVRRLSTRLSTQLHGDSSLILSHHPYHHHRSLRAYHLPGDSSTSTRSTSISDNNSSSSSGGLSFAEQSDDDPSNQLPAATVRRIAAAAALTVHNQGRPRRRLHRAMASSQANVFDMYYDMEDTPAFPLLTTASRGLHRPIAPAPPPPDLDEPQAQVDTESSPQGNSMGFIEAKLAVTTAIAEGRTEFTPGDVQDLLDTIGPLNDKTRFWFWLRKWGYVTKFKLVPITPRVLYMDFLIWNGHAWLTRRLPAIGPRGPLPPPPPPLPSPSAPAPAPSTSGPSPAGPAAPAAGGPAEPSAPSPASPSASSSSPGPATRPNRAARRYAERVARRAARAAATAAASAPAPGPTGDETSTA
ncbi:MAG: hypothetical protein M1838_003271 [Thelocarpon superellum]|nr:MAG: hypothetical protein M1838_003271 [Thelocarpon superellum]